jgi:hypothetical protein
MRRRGNARVGHRADGRTNHDRGSYPDASARDMPIPPAYAHPPGVIRRLAWVKDKREGGRSDARNHE